MLRSGVKPIAGGLFVGLLMTLAASVVLSRTIARTPMAIDTRDPLAYAAVILLLASAAVIAILIPARRAANADPLKSLRQE
jgi:ABC-type antimicrobial peptide transport system permease subunit